MLSNKGNINYCKREFIEILGESLRVLVPAPSCRFKGVQEQQPPLQVAQAYEHFFLNKLIYQNAKHIDSLKVITPKLPMINF